MITNKRATDLRINVVRNQIIDIYVGRIQAGETLDPVEIRGSRIIDGNHRAAAYKLLGMDIPTIPA